MSLITGPEIARGVAAGTIKIEPYDPAHLNPNSYNLRLGDRLLVYKKNLVLHDFHRRRWELWQEWRGGPTANGPWESEEQARDTFVHYHAPYPFPPLVPLDMAAEEPTTELVIPPTGLHLWPGVLYLGATMEYTETRGYAPKIDGRSSVGRLGKMIHVTAGFGDDGFCGDWTLEIVVVHPLTVYPGVPVCQIAFSTLEGERAPYQGQYQGQRGPKPSGLWRAVRKLLGRDA
jgi:dCTP deaminase